MSTALDTVLYTAKTHTVGGRTGAGKSSDGELDVTFRALCRASPAPIRSNCLPSAIQPVLSARSRWRRAR